MRKPEVLDTKAMHLRLIQLDSGNVDNPTNEDILAIALRNVLSTVAEQAQFALHGLDLENTSPDWRLTCLTKIEMANRVIRAAKEYLDKLPEHVYNTGRELTREEVERYYDRKLTHLDVGLPGDVAAHMRKQHIDAILANPKALREIAEELDEEQP